MWAGKLKKRHVKDLSLDEIDLIVSATKEPYRLHKDIAQQFRVSALLVSGLAREAEKNPQKQKHRRDNEI